MRLLWKNRPFVETQVQRLPESFTFYSTVVKIVPYILFEIIAAHLSRTHAEFLALFKSAVKIHFSVSITALLLILLQYTSVTSHVRTKQSYIKDMKLPAVLIYR